MNCAKQVTENPLNQRGPFGDHWLNRRAGGIPNALSRDGVRSHSNYVCRTRTSTSSYITEIEDALPHQWPMHPPEPERIDHLFDQAKFKSRPKRLNMGG